MCVNWKRGILKRINNFHKREMAVDLKNVFVTNDKSYSEKDGIENLNIQFRRVLKIRNSMPSEEYVSLLLTKAVYDKVEKLNNFRFIVLNLTNN